MNDVQQRFRYFITERDAARVRKEILGTPAPWSTDPIIANHRFCNINREDDRVTRWIEEHLRRPYAEYGKNFMVTNLTLARIFNEPSSLAYLVPFVDGKEAMKTIDRLRETEIKIFRGAYMMPAHGLGGKGLSTGEYWMNIVIQVSKMDFTQMTFLSDVADQLSTVKGLGDFLANQICTDLRYVAGYQWADWTTFIRCGPGTRRGLDRWHGREPEGNLNQKQYQEELPQVREDLKDMPRFFQVVFRDPNNLANSFCEFDKYERALGGKATLRKYGTQKS
jgi:hypothetical protein